MLRNSFIGLLVNLSSRMAFAGDANIMIVGGKGVEDAKILAATVGIKMGKEFGDGFCTGNYIGNNKVGGKTSRF